jgi:hypothetical protein
MEFWSGCEVFGDMPLIPFVVFLTSLFMVKWDMFGVCPLPFLPIDENVCL